jgi:hypothetical protein
MSKDSGLAEELVRRNAAAVIETLNQQNEILSGFEMKLRDLARQVKAFDTELKQVRAMQMKELVDQIGSGPTTPTEEELSA